MSDRLSEKHGDAFSSASPEESPENTSALEEFLVVASRLNASISDLPIFADQGIGSASWALLRALKDGPLSMDHLAQKASISRQRVRVQVRELEAKHLLAVSRQDEGDRRAHIVEITPYGAIALEKISYWLLTCNRKENGKRVSATTKQMRLLQRFFLKEKRVRQREARLHKINGTQTSLPSGQL